MVKKIFVFAILFMIVSFNSLSQLHIVISELPENTPSNSIIYLAGNVNGWNPKNDEYSFRYTLDEKWVLTLDSLAPEDSIEFKLTLGSWQLAEVDEDGYDIENRSYTYENSDTLYIEVSRWKEAVLNEVISSVANNVEIINAEFYMPQLDRYRRVWIYLPPDYNVALDHDYPLLYMHDGQNLFDNKTAYAGEWKIDEHLNTLFEEGYDVPIVVGIDHGGDFRGGEYTLEDNVDYQIIHEGDKYLAFITETLHPYITSHYRCTDNREKIGIMGSSLGGLISAYAIMTYPELFGIAGIYSPAYWINPKIFTLSFSSELSVKILQIAGSQESDTMVDEIILMDSLFHQNFKDSNIKFEIIEGGKHNETLWSNEFQKSIKTLYSSE